VRAWLWLWNSITGSYLNFVAKALPVPFPVPSEYRDIHLKFIDALEVGDSQAALKVMMPYLEGLDAAIGLLTGRKL